MKKLLSLFLILTIFTLGLSSCNKDKETKVYKIGLISGLGGFNDKSFNQASLNGFNNAKNDFSITTETKESFTTADLSANIDYFAAKEYDLVITMGYNFAQPVQTASAAYPGMDFLIIDVAYPSIPSNVVCATYAVDQVSFPAGVLAAYWADLKDHASPFAGCVSGPDSPLMQQFVQSYLQGVTYFNTKYGRSVGDMVSYASSFSDTLEGASLAANQINGNGADIIYAVAGSTGNGSLKKAKELGKWGIGVDVDQYYSLPDVSNILLTSCMKKIDVTVYDVIDKYIKGTFAGGTNINYTLGDGGVALAPFHDFDSQLPDSIKTLLIQVQNDIKSGVLSTGWK